MTEGETEFVERLDLVLADLVPARSGARLGHHRVPE